MSTSKHVRKTGATTVKRDGKIVGNIGVGKTKTPTVMAKTGFTVENPSQTFLPKVETVNENINYDNAVILWELMKNHKSTVRVNQISEFLTSLSDDDKKKFCNEHLNEADAFPKNSDLALYENLSPKAQMLLVHHPNPDIRLRCVLHAKMCNQEALAKFAHDDHGYVRAVVASKISSETSEEIFFLLAEDTVYTVRFAVAQNKATSVKVLRRMCYDSQPDTLDPSILQEVANHDNATSDILTKIYEITPADSWRYSSVVHHCLIKNEKCPKDILVKIVNDEYEQEYVREAAQTFLAMRN